MFRNDLIHFCWVELSVVLKCIEPFFFLVCTYDDKPLFA